MPIWFDHRCIDPSAAEVEADFQEAFEQLEAESDVPQRWLADVGDNVLAAVTGTRSGVWSWFDQAPQPQVEDIPFVWHAWWTDPLGRTHRRTVSGQDLLYQGPVCVGDVPCPRQPATPALALIEPERVAWRMSGDQHSVLVSCDCGAAGSPEAVNWTGDCCGPCHDQRQEGAAPSKRAGFCSDLDLEGPSLPALCPRGPLLAARISSGEYCILDARSEEEPDAIAVDQDVHCLAWTPDGMYLALGGAIRNARRLVPSGRAGKGRLVHRTFRGGPVGQVTLWDVARGAERWSKQPHKDGVQALAFSTDGSLLATAFPGEGFRVYEVGSGSQVLARLGYEGARSGLAFSPDGKTLAVASSRDVVTLWDLATQKQVATESLGFGPVACSFSPDGRTLALWPDPTGVRFARGGSFWRVVLWDVPSCSVRASVPWEVQHVCWSPAAPLLALLYENEGVTLHEADGHERARLRWLQYPPLYIAFSPEGNSLLTVRARPGNPVQAWPLSAFL